MTCLCRPAKLACPIVHPRLIEPVWRAHPGSMCGLQVEPQGLCPLSLPNHACGTAQGLWSKHPSALCCSSPCLSLRALSCLILSEAQALSLSTHSETRMSSPTTAEQGLCTQRLPCMTWPLLRVMSCNMLQQGSLRSQVSDPLGTLSQHSGSPMKWLMHSPLILSHLMRWCAA